MNRHQKYLYLELMRILACFFVIFNHTGNNGFFLFSQRPWGGLQFWIYMFVSIFCKFSVPVFFAISGALLLSKNEEPLKALWCRRIARIAGSLLAFSLIYYIAEIFLGRQTWNLSKFFSQLYDSNWNFSFWYLYAYLQMLITLPLLRALARNLENQYFYYGFAVALFFYAVLPTVQFLLWQDRHSLNGNLRPGWLTANTVMYPLMGYFLHNKVCSIEKKGRLISLMWIFNVLTIALCCIMTYKKAKLTGECSEGVSQTFHNTFVMVNTAAIFLSSKYLAVTYEDKLSQWFKKAVFAVGKGTFGIYLWHVLVLRLLTRFKIWELFRDKLDLNYMISAFLVCLCVMVAGYGLTWPMQKIPLIRKLVS